MIVKKIRIDDQEVLFAASARTPRLYRQVFGRDVIVDMTSLYSNFQSVLKERNAEKFEDLDQTTQLSLVDLTTFENLAYIMARQADPTIPSNPDDWLDGFNTFDIYDIFPKLLELWNLNQKGMSVAKKK